jgi:branched-chain amino acid transport system substrate-binding protein
MRPRGYVVFLGVLALVAAACQGEGGEPQEGEGRGRTYKIGVATGQTGYLAVTDGPTLQGFELGVDEINENGGIDGTWTIELDVRNTQSDPAQTATVTQQLIEDGAQMVLTPCDQDPSVAGGQIAQRQGIPAISLCASTPTLPELVGDFMFSNWYGDNVTGYVLANYARELGYETAYLHLSPDTAYTQKLPEYFAEAFEEAGGRVLGQENYAIDQQDFSASVTRLQNLDPKPDVIFTSAYGAQLSSFLQQFRAANVDIAFFAAEGMDDPSILELPPDVIDGVVFTSAGFEEPGTPLAEFNGKFEERYGEPAGSVFPAAGYDLAKVIEAAVTAAGSTDPAAVRDAIAELADVQGATGPITYTGTNGMPVKTIALQEITNGEKTLISVPEVDPATLPAP